MIWFGSIVPARLSNRRPARTATTCAGAARNFAGALAICPRTDVESAMTAMRTPMKAPVRAARLRMLSPCVECLDDPTKPVAAYTAAGTREGWPRHVNNRPRRSRGGTYMLRNIVFKAHERRDAIGLLSAGAGIGLIRACVTTRHYGISRFRRDAPDALLTIGTGLTLSGGRHDRTYFNGRTTPGCPSSRANPFLRSSGSMSARCRTPVTTARTTRTTSSSRGSAARCKRSSRASPRETCRNARRKSTT